MLSGEEKLARCRTCGERRMMPIEFADCLECEEERRVAKEIAAGISAEDARWIITFREPEQFVRFAWGLANEFQDAVVGIDMRTGKSEAEKWAPELNRTEAPYMLVCAHVPASRKAELPGLLNAGAEVPLSEEAIEEHVVRAALGEDGERFWAAIEEQLRAFESKARGEK